MKKVFNLIFILVMLVIFIMSLAMISTAEGKTISYKSTRNSGIPLKFSYLVHNNITHHNGLQNKKYYDKDLYYVIDNYDTYKYLGFTDKSKSFFNNNLLIINSIISVGSIYKTFINNGVTINDGIINVSYTRTSGVRNTCNVAVFSDIIELKKSDVKGVDLTKQKVTIRTVQLTSRPEDGQIPDTYSTEGLTYVDANKLIEKPSKVEKVNVMPIKTKQLKVTWKKIKGSTYERKTSFKNGMKKQLKVKPKNIIGVKYEVKYSLKKSMKNAKVKKNIKKNNVTLKNLKSGKKYYIKVRAYLKLEDKIYRGKWSKKAVKVVR